MISARPDAPTSKRCRAGPDLAGGWGLRGRPRADAQPQAPAASLPPHSPRGGRGPPALLGVGQLFAVISQQMLCVRCSRMRSRESVFGNYMVASAIGQGLGPLIVAWSGGDATVPPTQFLFAAGFAASVVALACAVPIRPSRRRGKPQGGKEITPVR